jgi:hypothetical protein
MLRRAPIHRVQVGLGSGFGRCERDEECSSDDGACTLPRSHE